MAVSSQVYKSSWVLRLFLHCAPPYALTFAYVPPLLFSLFIHTLCSFFFFPSSNVDIRETLSRSSFHLNACSEIKSNQIVKEAHTAPLRLWCMEIPIQFKYSSLIFSSESSLCCIRVESLPALISWLKAVSELSHDHSSNRINVHKLAFRNETTWPTGEDPQTCHACM